MKAATHRDRRRVKASSRGEDNTAETLAFEAGKKARRHEQSPISPYDDRRLKAAFRRGYAFEWHHSQGLRPLDTARVLEAERPAGRP